MIELTTGVLFLMSSMYGSGQSTTHIENIKNSQISEADMASEETADQDFINDQKGMEAYLRKEFASAPILVDIARCESNYKQFDKDGNIIRGIVNNADIGVMQINEKYHDDTAKILNYDLHTVSGNVTYAKHLYDEQGTAPWKSSSKCWSAALATNSK